MKTSVIRIACVASIVAASSIFRVSAQSESNFFFDRKYANEQLISQIKYELAYSGNHEPTAKFEYTYDESGRLVKKEAFGRDRKKLAWEPDYCFVYTYNRGVSDNVQTCTYVTWNKKTKQYNSPAEKAVYLTDEIGNVLAWMIMTSKDKNPAWNYNGALKTKNSAYFSSK